MSSSSPKIPKHKLKKLLRGAVSAPARAARLQRIYARLQEGCTVGEIAAHEGLTPPRVRQILVEAAQSKRPEDRPDHVRMQIARLAPALKGLVASATSGETEDVPVLLRALAQLDGYARENFLRRLALGRNARGRHRGARRRRRAEPRAGFASGALWRGRRSGPHKLDRSLFNGADFPPPVSGWRARLWGKRLGRRAKTKAGNGERRSGRRAKHMGSSSGRRRVRLTEAPLCLRRARRQAQAAFGGRFAKLDPCARLGPFLP